MAPELTIVIPTRNRRDLLRGCLESLARQHADRAAFEVVVVVDGSTDGTLEMLERLSAPFRLRVLPQPGVGQGAARNAGAGQAGGRYLLFLDDDMVASEALVSAHLRAVSAGEDIVGIGRVRQRPGHRADRLARARVTDLDRHYERLVRKSANFRDCYSGNLSMSRRLYERVGGFGTDLARALDVELGYRLLEAGAEFVYVEEAVSTEEVTLGWRALVRDAERRGAESLELYRRHPPALAWLELGGYGGGRRWWAIVRAALLGARLPAEALALAGVLVPGRREPSLRRTRLIMDYAYWKGVRRATRDGEEWRRLARGVTILLYHALGGPGETASRYIVPADRFGRQMRWLRRLGFNVISLDELLELRRAHRLPPPRTILVTFDDGYTDNLEVAAPILEDLGMAATFFVVSGKRRNDWDGDGEELRDRPLLSPGDLRGRAQLLSAGAHTRTHAELTSIPAARAREELSGSRVDLEQALGYAVKAFAYPYGSYDAEIRAAAREAGFECALTATPGSNRPATDSFELLRLEIWGTDTLPRFLVTLWFGNTHLS